MGRDTDLYVRIRRLNSLLQVWEVVPNEVEQVQVLRPLMSIS